MLKLGAEDSVLLLTCRPHLSTKDDSALRRLTKTSINWEYLLWRAENNRTLPLLYHHLERLELFDSVDAAVLEYLKTWVLLSKIRSIEQFRSLLAVIEAFDAEGINFFLLKGAALTLLYSPDPLTRPMQDLDLMIHQEDAVRAQSLLFKLGYNHGIFDPATGITTPAERTLSSESFRDHHALPAFMKVITRESPLPAGAVPKALRYKHVKCHITSARRLLLPLFMDLHVTLSVGLDIQDVWSGTHLETVFGQTIRVQSITGMLWFIAARVYHEAFEFNTYKLSMFGDVDTLVRAGGSSIDWSQLLAISYKYEMRPALYYVLAQAQQIMGTEVPDAVLDLLRPEATGLPLDRDWGDLLPKLLTVPHINEIQFA